MDSATEMEQRVRRSFDRQAAMSTIGARLVRVEAGAVDIELPFRDDLTQQHGFLHAGILATIVDSACGYAAFTLMPTEAGVLSVEYKINLMSPARGDRFLAEGRVVRAGRTITVCRGEGVAIDADRRKTIAVMHGTMMTLLDRPGIEG